MSVEGRQGAFLSSMRTPYQAHDGSQGRALIALLSSIWEVFSSTILQQTYAAQELAALSSSSSSRISSTILQQPYAAQRNAKFAWPNQDRTPMVLCSKGSQTVGSLSNHVLLRLPGCAPQHAGSSSARPGASSAWPESSAPVKLYTLPFPLLTNTFCFPEKPVPSTAEAPPASRPRAPSKWLPIPQSQALQI
eukprot:1159871-Pelagomonas_calceolata.AAC.13